MKFVQITTTVTRDSKMKITMTLSEVSNKCDDWDYFCVQEGIDYYACKVYGHSTIELTEQKAINYGIIAGAKEERGPSKDSIVINGRRVELTENDNFGTLYDMADFVDDCNDHSLLDCDGHGLLANRVMTSDICVRPSNVRDNTHKFIDHFTHVMWYNK